MVCVSIIELSVMRKLVRCVFGTPSKKALVSSHSASADSAHVSHRLAVDLCSEGGEASKALDGRDARGGSGKARGAHT